ncbi:S-adenosyl-L-methionine-dependent methyltransferase [Pilobolus umbonatus]|nr:S-adenosyl-L-methionine-dependent methyltransferase [Pilobolus umbonatus]
MAESYPNSKFTGVDVSFVFPEAIRPPNVSFEISNIARELTFADNTFDFYFQRLMIVALNRSDYALALKNAYRVLKPGGYIELVEPNLGDFGKMGPLLKDLLNTMSALMEMKGMTPNLGDTLEDLLKVAGFVNIQVIVKVFPINHTNKIGKLWWEDIERGYHNVRPMLALKNPDFEEPGCYKKYLDGIADECAKHMTDSRLHIVYAQKPFN